MHGLFNRSMQRFITTAYGEKLWEDVARQADLDPPRFEALLTYDDRLTHDVVAAAEALLVKPAEELLEDLGTFLITNASSDAVRRLLRFGGADFSTFLQSLSDLPDRARMALPDLELPIFSLSEIGADTYILECRTPHPEYCHVTLGALRAMADDYGALASLEMKLEPGLGATIRLQVFEARHHAGREFALGVRAS